MFEDFVNFFNHNREHYFNQGIQTKRDVKLILPRQSSSNVIFVGNPKVNFVEGMEEKRDVVHNSDEPCGELKENGTKCYYIPNDLQKIGRHLWKKHYFEKNEALRKPGVVMCGVCKERMEEDFYDFHLVSHHQGRVEVSCRYPDCKVTNTELMPFFNHLKTHI